MKKNKENIKKVRDFFTTPQQYIKNSDVKIEEFLDSLTEESNVDEILNVISTVNGIPNEFNNGTSTSVTQLKQEVLVKYLNKL